MEEVAEEEENYYGRIFCQGNFLCALDISLKENEKVEGDW